MSNKNTNLAPKTCLKNFFFHNCFIYTLFTDCCDTASILQANCAYDRRYALGDTQLGTATVVRSLAGPKVVSVSLVRLPLKPTTTIIL